MTDEQVQLARTLRNQESFAATYSPLYQQVFGALADLVENEPHDPATRWLAKMAEFQPPVELSLLVPAALHRGVLAGDPALADLAQFYPSVGGVVPDPDIGALRPILLAALRDYGPRMEPFVRMATVQTNETARGLAWLLPLMFTGWPAVHLLELGASAGLNLLADGRSYQLVDRGRPEQVALRLGHGQPVQFITRFEDCPITLQARPLPHIATRTGLDVAPFPLRDEADEQTLMSFVWADQTARIARLREGIAALRAAEQAGQAPVLHAVRLPDDLNAFLQRYDPQPGPLPIVIYNTVMTMYLTDGEAGLRKVVDSWASAQQVPILWLQWEPSTGPEHALPWGWMSWTADLWQDGRHDHFDLAWVHAHGTDVQWRPDLARWAETAAKLRWFA